MPSSLDSGQPKCDSHYTCFHANRLSASDPDVRRYEVFRQEILSRPFGVQSRPFTPLSRPTKHQNVIGRVLSQAEGKKNLNEIIFHRSVSDKDVRKYEVFRQKMLAAASGANDKIGGASADGEEFAPAERERGRDGEGQSEGGRNPAKRERGQSERERERERQRERESKT